MTESHQENLRSVVARINMWLTLHEASSRLLPQSQTDDELVFEQIPVGDHVVQLDDGMPFVQLPYRVKAAPPSKLGKIFMTKADLGDLRNIHWYCNQTTWKTIEPIFLTDKGPILVGDLRDLRLMGIRIIDGVMYTVPLEYLENDLAIPKFGQSIDDGRNVWPAIVRVNDFRRQSGDAIDRALSVMQDGLDKMVMSALLMDRDIESAQLIFLEQQLRQAQTARWGNKK